MPRILPGYREEVRKKIVESAHALFLRNGYHGTTMEDIAERLGVSKPALYQYFPGKEDLYAAVAEYGREELAATLERSFEGRNFQDATAVLFDSLLRYVPQFNGMYSELMLLATHNDRIRDLLVDDRMEDHRVIEQFIIRKQKKGLLPKNLDPRTLAIACDALINGLLIDVVMGMDKDEAKKIWIDTVTRLVRAD